MEDPKIVFDQDRITANVKRVIAQVATILLTVGGLITLVFPNVNISPELVQGGQSVLDSAVGYIMAAAGAVVGIINWAHSAFGKGNAEDKVTEAIVERKIAEHKKSA